MTNIKQKFLKFIISFACLVFIASCDQAKNPSSIKDISKKKAVDVAILLPLSESKLGKEYAQMVKIGLSDAAKTKIHVTSYDSSTPERLNESLDKILESNTKIIIGPIYSETTTIVANKVKDKDIIVLSLSNNPVLADKQIFVYGHAPMRQLKLITNYFLSNNYKNYIALIPAGRHSELTSKVLSDMISNAGANLSAIEFYGSAPEDIAKSVQSVSTIVDNLNENDFNLTKPVILLADDSETLQMVYRDVQKYNLDKKAILAGDNRTDISFSPPTNITFTGSINITDKDLIMRTQKANISHISFMHAIAYDAGKMTGEYINTNYSKENFLNKMNSSEPFIGISGKINFIDSIAQRKYHIIKKTQGEYENIEQANLDDMSLQQINAEPEDSEQP